MQALALLGIIAASLMLAGILMLFLPILLTIVGILWSPFAALICGLAARRNGLPAGKYARTGWSYSVQMILPWIYLVALQFGKPPPARIVRIGYKALYSLWAFLIILSVIAFIGALLSTNGVFGDANPDTYSSFGMYIPSMLIAIAGSAVNYLLLRKSLRDLRRKWREDSENPKQDELPYAPPHEAYTRPFKLMPLGVALGWLAWGAVVMIYLLTPTG